MGMSLSSGLAHQQHVLHFAGSPLTPKPFMEMTSLTSCSAHQTSMLWFWFCQSRLFYGKAGGCMPHACAAQGLRHAGSALHAKAGGLNT